MPSGRGVCSFLPEDRQVYRNIFSVVPRGKVKDVGRMLKAIHAPEHSTMFFLLLTGEGFGPTCPMVRRAKV